MFVCDTPVFTTATHTKTTPKERPTMTRIPSRVAVASLDTHRLIVAVANDGQTDVASNLAPHEAAHVLRQIADEYDRRAGRCGLALFTGRPCPVHDTPASPSEAQRPAGLDSLLDHLGDHLATEADDDQAADEPDALTADEVREALTFNADEDDPALATLRDVLLDTTATRTPAQALAAARILLEAHARQIATLVEAQRNTTERRAGLSRSTRGLLTGYSIARRTITAYADGLAAAQALTEAADREQAKP